MGKDIDNKIGKTNGADANTFGIPPLKFKTHKDPNLHGKPRVYFCCHPADFKRYFEEISEDILKYSDCVIYYCENGENLYFENAERQDELKNMQLFVIPVTSNLLIKPSIAMDKEFAFALANTIPVLPIMPEGNLEGELYDKKFGDLQYLDKYNWDATAIPFDEKLKKYLEGVLVGDELAKKIRDAFDAYIFLSYRKKDRKYAQELMRLIHKNAFCRDIAIWYDEFLVPGEGFNKAIEEALKKSELFTLLVTPNLVNENNYVMEKEYPMARTAGKKILPAKSLEVDEEKLKENFSGITECVDVHEETELSDALLSYLKGIAIANDGPEHNFFIGLAYLNGIDVEVDREKALELITSSAEANLPEAMEKLVAMYRAGEGVERDYAKAIEWQQRLAEFWESEYIKSGDLHDGAEAMSAYWYLGNLQYEMRKLQDAKRSYTKMNTLASEIPETEESKNSLQRCLSTVFNKLGDTAKAESNLTKAKEYYTVDVRRGLSVSFERLGDTAKAEGDLAKAKEYYTKALEISQQLADETQTVEAHRNLSVSFDNLGDTAQAESNLPKAKEYYTKALEIRQQLAEETQTIDARSDLSISFERLGNIAQAEGNLTKAKEYYTKALEISQQLAEETQTVEARRNLSISFEELGDIAKAEGVLPKAKGYYTKCLEIFQQLVEETQTVDTRRGLSVSLGKLGEIAEAEGDLAKAKEYYTKGLEIFQQLAEETQTVEARRDLSFSFNRLGDIAKAEGNLAKAKEYYTQALEIRQQLAEETQTVLARRDLSVSFGKIGEIAEAEGDLVKAKEYYTKYLKINQQLAKETQAIEVRRDLSVSFGKLGDIAKAEDDLTKAKEYYTKCLEISRQLADETQTIEAHRDLSISFEKLGDIAKAESDLSKAKEYYIQKLQIDQKLTSETNTAEDRRNLSISFERLGDIAQAESDLAKAKEYYTKGHEIFQQLVKETQTISSYDDLAVSYYKCALADEENSGKEMLKEALDIWTRLSEMYPDYAMFRKRKEIVAGLLAFL